jgi:hypothetical protein
LLHLSTALNIGYVTRDAIVNFKAIYLVGGGIAAAAVAIFVLLGQGNLALPGQNSQSGNQTQIRDIQVSVKEILAEKTDDRNADVKITFDAFNPNRNTAILETIHYTIYIDRLRMTTGDIGVSPEGFLASQEGIFPIIGNTSISLRDTQVAVRNNITATSWDGMVEGTATYRIEGTYLYKLTGTGFQFSAGEKDFVLTYP